MTRTWGTEHNRAGVPRALALGTVLAMLAFGGCARDDVTGAASIPSGWPALTSTTCPPDHVEPPDLHASLPGAAEHLVPVTPTSALLCLYGQRTEPGSGGTATSDFDAGAPTHLVATRYVDDATEAARIGHRLDAVAGTPGPALPRPCGTPTGTVLDVYFRTHTRQVEVAVEIGGCRGGSNGTWTSAWLGSGDTEEYLAALVPIPQYLR